MTMLHKTGNVRIM